MPQDEVRVALVIGNSRYRHTSPLRNPVNDANRISDALRRTGFNVMTVNDQTRTGLHRAIQRFSAEAVGADVALFFYSGHAVQVKGKNWLLPTDARISSPADIELVALPMDLVLNQMASRAKVNLAFLDACRDNPFASQLYADARSAALSKGLSRPRVKGDMYVAFATAPGEIALDGRGENSPFSEALLKHITTPGLEIDTMMRMIRKDVKTRTAGERIQQIPWGNSSLTEEFYFVPR